MRRRRESIFEQVMSMPWWVGVTIAVVGFIGIAYLIPAYLAKSSPLLSKVPGNLNGIAWIWFGMFMFAGLASAIRGMVVRRKFDNELTGIEAIRNLSWAQFEIMVGESFRRQGYAVVENGGGGADGGIDLVLHKGGKKFFVQCKQWKVFTIGVKPIRELFGVVKANGADGGIFVTSGNFTKDAREFANTSGIELIDGVRLERMIAAVRAGRVVAQSSDTSDTLVPSPSRPLAMACPRCGSSMILRTARVGANAGSQFWGCITYPKCKGTREVAEE